MWRASRVVQMGRGCPLAARIKRLSSTLLAALRAQIVIKEGHSGRAVSRPTSLASNRVLGGRLARQIVPEARLVACLWRVAVVCSLLTPRCCGNLSRDSVREAGAVSRRDIHGFAERDGFRNSCKTASLPAFSNRRPSVTYEGLRQTLMGV